jgi:hypothetical protein
MSAHEAAVSIPGVRAWRRRAREARRGHHLRKLSETLTDLYTLLWFVLIYGGALYSEVGRHLRTPEAVEGQVERHWLAVAALLAGAGLAWRVLREVGPMLASPADLHWALSSPMSRRGWLAGRFAGALIGGAIAGAAAAFTVVLLGIRGRSPGLAALGGAVYGTAVAASSVLAQASPPRRRWPGAIAVVLLGTGGALALAVVVAHYTGRAVPRPTAGIGPVLLYVGVALAGVTVWRAGAALPRLDRSRLGGGAQLAAAVVTSAVWMDLTVIGGVLDVRRWRRVGWVRSRRFGWSIPGVPARAWALVQAEVVRTTRRPGALGFWAALVLAEYGIAVAAPSLAGAARIVLAYLAVGRLMAGLRTVARSEGLRRSLGGSEATLRVAHVVVPAAGALLWWAATVPADGIGLTTGGLVLAAGIVAAAYRSATRGPIDYSEAIVEMGVSQLPVGLIRQVVRGPDLLGAVLIVRLFMH